jgi:two-component system sensor histidine kinase KdpD
METKLRRGRWTVVVRGILSVAAVGGITAVCDKVFSVNATTAGFSYLIGVLCIGTVWGMAEAVLASVAATLCFNYFFLPPIGRLTIADPQNWVALLAFLVTALMASHLSDRANRQALDARRRQRETEQLYAVSRAILLSEASRPLCLQVAHAIATIFECDAVALFDAASGELYRGGPEDIAGIEAKLKQVVLRGTSLHEPDSGLLVAPVTLGGQPIGSLAARRMELPDGALHALLNLVAIALERVRAQEAATRAEVARQSEEFKSTLLDAIAHEFKTPLTSIKAASTAILSDGQAVPAPLRELVAIIDEETDRLSLLVTEAARMAEIEAGNVRLEKQPTEVQGLLDRVLERFRLRLEGRSLNLRLSYHLPRIMVDGDLISLALRQVIDNGLKYSSPGTALDVAAEAGEQQVILIVRDRGPGISSPEIERVFEKFYRRDTVRQRVPGSGLGLYIAREIARAHGGELEVHSTPGEGAEFRLTLPAAEAPATA